MTEENKKQMLENNIILENKVTNQRKKKDEQKIKKRITKVRGDEGYIRHMEKAKKSSIINESEIDGFDFDDYSKCREIIFKIKLSQDEYKLLLKEKKNKGHLSPYLFK